MSEMVWVTCSTCGKLSFDMIARWVTRKTTASRTTITIHVKCRKCGQGYSKDYIYRTGETKPYATQGAMLTEEPPDATD